MSFIYRQKQNIMLVHNVINSIMDESVKKRKINIVKSIFNFASCEEIDIALQDCEGDETLVLYKMSFSMYLENIRQIIEERQTKVYLSCCLSDEQKIIAAQYKNDETTTIPSITEPPAYSSSNLPILSTTLTQNTNEDNMEIEEKHPLEYNNHHLFRNVCPDELKKKGKWSEEEDVLFMNRLEEFGRHGPWGEFSLVIPGRNGYQCRDHYKALVKRGLVDTRKFSATKFSGKQDKIDTRDDEIISNSAEEEDDEKMLETIE